MKTKITIGWITLVSFALAGTGSLWITGCNKTNYPFGIYAPNGVDNPYVPGSFNISVQDNGAPVSGVNVLMVDAVGNTLAGQTASSGIASFNSGNIMTGVWNALIPTQAVTISSSPLTVDSFYQSVQPVTVASSGIQPVTFNAPTQSVSIWSLNLSENYPYGGSDFAYGVSYIQPGNLDEPVSLSLSGLPNNWTAIFNPPIIGRGINSGALTIIVPCTAAQPNLSIVGSKSNGTSIVGNMLHISRNYPIHVRFALTSTIFDSGCGGYDNNYLFSSTNDCGVTWSITYSGGKISNLTNGTPVSFSCGNFDSYGGWNLTSSLWSFTGSNDIDISF